MTGGSKGLKTQFADVETVVVVNGEILISKMSGGTADNAGARAGREFACSSDIVIMEVSFQNVSDTRTSTFSSAQVDIYIAARIDNGGEPAFAVSDEVGLMAQPFEKKLFNMHHCPSR